MLVAQAMISEEVKVKITKYLNNTMQSLFYDETSK